MLPYLDRLARLVLVLEQDGNALVDEVGHLQKGVWRRPAEKWAWLRMERSLLIERGRCLGQRKKGRGLPYLDKVGLLEAARGERRRAQTDSACKSSGN